MNYITVGDAYSISRKLTESGNIYGLSSSNADSHLMKNSEWGAVAYLSQSQYGLNGTNIAINNVSLNNTTETIYAVTGCASTAENSSDASTVATTIESLNAGSTAGVASWTQKAGTAASSTGTIYGIYDLSGGLAEETAGFVVIEGVDTSKKAGGLLTETNGKYVMEYEVGATNTYESNYDANSVIGDAIKETSAKGSGCTSWFMDWSVFPGKKPGYQEWYMFSVRGGKWWYGSQCGVFAFGAGVGQADFHTGFRPVLVAK
jgi:hypothetical protein